MLNLFLFCFLEFPDPLDLATGIEKKEMLLRLGGNDVSIIINYLKYDYSRLNFLYINTANFFCF